MLYFRLSIPTTPQRLAQYLETTIKDILPPTSIPVGQPPDQRLLMIIGIELREATEFEPIILTVRAKSFLAGPPFSVGAPVSMVLGIDKADRGGITLMTAWLFGAEPGRVLLEGDCENVFGWYMKLLIANLKTAYVGVRELTPMAAKRKECLTWADTPDESQTSGGGGASRRRGVTIKTQERFKLFEAIKAKHPDWGYDTVAMEANRQAGTDNYTAETVRYAYRAMGVPWERADRIR